MNYYIVKENLWTRFGGFLIIPKTTFGKCYIPTLKPEGVGQSSNANVLKLKYILILALFCCTLKKKTFFVHIPRRITG